tara:strand:- start:556 stop:1596 length:1041 start_codon:yes stop_codon:yes gene_type:complete
MAKMNLGIIAVLGIGVGAFIISKMNKDKIESQQPIEQPISNIPISQTLPVIESINEVVVQPQNVTPKTSILHLTSIDMFGFSEPLDIRETVRFYANITSGDGLITYDWNFGDGKISRGTDKQYESHEYNTHGQYTISLTVSNNFGEISTKSKTFNVRANPVKQGDITHNILPQIHSAIVKLTNNHSEDVTGRLSITLNGVNTTRLSSNNVYIKSGSSTEIDMNGLTSGYTTFNVDFVPNESSIDVIIDDNKTVYIEPESELEVVVEPTTETTPSVGTCSPSPEIQSIVHQLNTVFDSPDYFMNGNVKDVMECKISESSFLYSFNVLWSNGTITPKSGVNTSGLGLS